MLMFERHTWDVVQSSLLPHEAKKKLKAQIVFFYNPQLFLPPMLLTVEIVQRKKKKE